MCRMLGGISMKHFEFKIESVLEITAETKEEAERIFRESFNPNKEYFNAVVDAKEIPAISYDVYEKYAVNWK